MQAFDVAARTGDLSAAATVSTGQVHVEEGNVGGQGVTRGDGSFDVGGVPNDVEVSSAVLEFVSNPGANHGVIVDDEDTDGHCVLPVGIV